MNKREEDLCSLLQLLLPFVPLPAAIDATLCDSEKWFNVACAETYVDQSTQEHTTLHTLVSIERQGRDMFLFADVTQIPNKDVRITESWMDTVQDVADRLLPHLHILSDLRNQFSSRAVASVFLPCYLSKNVWKFWDDVRDESTELRFLMS